ncbi:MAG TPA: hypothetical protein VJ960_09845 [Oceanipulchritudo sp.]|nr:hypothetical protein [Oceanipulchritudo sp.]
MTLPLEAVTHNSIGWLGTYRGGAAVGALIAVARFFSLTEGPGRSPYVFPRNRGACGLSGIAMWEKVLPDLHSIFRPV